tara:strand:+ start:75613 stop:76356 length:744 start_codon:yes stop_codon:yes gene_type:complete
MDKMLFVTMSGAENTFLSQSLNANNLANVGTAGFKADLAQFRSMPVMSKDSLPTRVYALTERPATDFTPGPLMTTGRDFDVAIKGEGFFAVKSETNEDAYSRDGALQINEQGLLTNSRGLAVMGEGGEINIPPAQKVEIGNDGSISFVPLGANPDAVVLLDRIKLVKPDISNLEKGLDGLFYTKDNTVLSGNPDIKLAKGFLEGSNVNAVESITNMISLSRQYEIQLKMIKQAEAIDEASTSLLRVS